MRVYYSIRNRQAMQTLNPFFRQTTVDLSTLKANEGEVKISDQQTNLTMVTTVRIGSDNIPYFIIQGQTYSLHKEIKMEPFFRQGAPKCAYIEKLTLHSGESTLEMNSSNSNFITTVYESLKKIISHKGFNEYFTPLKRLGRGSFAAVYLIESKATGKKLAAKVFSREGQKLGYKGKESLEKEIENLKLLSHPNIIEFDGIYETNNLIYMVTEYLSGGTLVQFMRNNTKTMGDHIVKILKDILSALLYLKKQHIMHRDLKPQNIVLRKEDNKWVLVDFGLAAFSNEQYLYDKCGTLGYMAPEIQHQNNGEKQPYNQACDIYSLGVVCYQLFLGFLPFKVEMENMYDRKYIWEGLTKKECTELEPAIVQLLKGLLETDPVKRWTPAQCLQCECLKNASIVEKWKEYKQKVNNQRYDKILKMRQGN